MSKLIKVLQDIGNQICEGCGPESDCGMHPTDCSRVTIAAGYLCDYNAALIDVDEEDGGS